MQPKIATIDFHVTSECSQECPYCWGPQGFDRPVDEATARRIIAKIREVGARRIVFTGGDPLRRSDLGSLIRNAHEIGLEVAVSTTGDLLNRAFLEDVGDCIDLVSLPLDGSTEQVSSRTKEPGHLDAVLSALEALRGHPGIDVKICTPVTRRNLADVPNIASLVFEYARSTEAQVFYNVFQAFPRAMLDVDWNELLVSDEEFAALERQIMRAERRQPERPGSGAADEDYGGSPVSVNFLDHATLDRLYAMVFPDGRLVIPSGPDFLSYGPFLEIESLDTVLDSSGFDSAKHLRHSKGWEKTRHAAGTDTRQSKSSW